MNATTKRPGSWQDLKREFLLQIDDAPAQTAGLWLDVWRLLIEHPWYQEQLAACARQEMRRVRAPDEWLDDVKQDAMLLLARRLRLAPDLRIDRRRAREHFPGWMGTIIRRHCQEALRRMRRLHHRTQEILDQDIGREPRLALEAKIDLSMMLDKLAEPERTVVVLSAKNWSLREIADALEFSYWKTRRIHLRGLEQLRKLLDS